MYVLAFCPPIIPLLILVPLLFALYVDKRGSNNPLPSNIRQLLLGFFLGSLVYLALTLGYGGHEKFPWDPIQIAGIIFPVLLGGIYYFRKSRGQLKLPSFSQGSIGAGILFLLLSAAPFVLPWILIFLDVRVVVAMLFFPILFGLWLLLSVSNYSWKYFTAYVILSVFSALIYAFVLYGFSID